MGRAGGRGAALCWAGAAFTGLALGGCAATEKLGTSSDLSATFGNLLAFNTTNPGPVQSAAAAHEEPLRCPVVEVLEGTAAYRTYAGAEQSNANVRYQYSLGDVARECTKTGGQLLLKVGVAGRVLLGPAGSSGSFTVPVRIAVRRASDQKPAAAKLYQVPAAIAEGESATSFQVVSDTIAVPFVTSHADDDYTILVGFDAATKPPVAAGPVRGPRSRNAVKPAPQQPPG